MPLLVATPRGTPPLGGGLHLLTGSEDQEAAEVMGCPLGIQACGRPPRRPTEGGPRFVPLASEAAWLLLLGFVQPR